MAEDDELQGECAASAGDAGERLRNAREAQKLSVDDVAHSLHLDREVILALEAGDYSLLGAPVFVRGHMRSYARLLGLPEQLVVAKAEPSEPDPELFRTQSVQHELKPGFQLNTVVLGALLLLLVLAVMLYVFTADDGYEPPITNPATTPVESVVPEVSLPEPEAVAAADEVALTPPALEDSLPEDATVSGALDSAAGVRQSGAPVVAETSGTVTDTREAAVADTRLIGLELAFSAECWVELADARRRLLYGLEKPGSVRRYEAEPPLRVFLGNVDAATIRIEGQEYPVPEAQRTGNNTARFVLTAADIDAIARLQQ